MLVGVVCVCVRLPWSSTSAGVFRTRWVFSQQDVIIVAARRRLAAEFEVVEAEKVHHGDLQLAAK